MFGRVGDGHANLLSDIHCIIQNTRRHVCKYNKLNREREKDEKKRDEDKEREEERERKEKKEEKTEEETKKSLRTIFFRFMLFCMKNGNYCIAGLLKT